MITLALALIKCIEEAAKKNGAEMPDVCIQEVLQDGRSIGWRVYVEAFDLIFFVTDSSTVSYNHMGTADDGEVNYCDIDALVKVLNEAIDAA